MRKLFTLLLAVAASVGTMFAWDYERVQIGDLYYNLDATNQTAEVTYKSIYNEGWGITTANIPASVTYNEITYSVTSIGGWAFSGCSGLTSVTIPNSVTSIGESAFQTCSGLTSIEIPNSVTSIEESAFAWCYDLTSVTIGNGVTIIGDGAFFVCTRLTSVSIPNSVTSIGDNAFNGCFSLASVTIPNSVTSIGEGAFYECSGLISVTIPNSVTSIGDNAFYYFPNIEYYGTAVGSPWGARSVNGYIENYLIYENVSKTVLLACFKKAKGNIVIPNSVTTIGDGAFYQCNSMTSVTIPNSVTSIGKGAFEGCSSLTSPVYNTHVFAFMPTSYYGAYTMPEGIGSIAGRAFYECGGLTSIDIPNSVTSIGDGAFLDCSGLVDIYMEGNPPTISSSSTFRGIPSKTLVYVPFGYTEAYKSASYWKNMNILGPDIQYSFDSRSTSTSIEFNVENTDIQSCGVEGGIQQSGNVLDYIGLEPNTEYSDVHIVLTANTGETETVNVSFTTTALTLTTKPSKPVSATTAILLAETNMSDAEVNCGFEWKRNDAPADMAGTKVFCPVASGQMAGRLKNLRDDTYYKYRAFYQSAAGNMYYGDWQYIFTGDVAVEFDPILYTYGATVVRENEATISGYALAGSEDFTEQGFEYWAESRTNNGTNAPRRMPAALGEHFFVQASGIALRVTLTNLDAGTVYKYRVYGKVGDQYYYGSEQTFTTTGTYTPPTYTITFANWDGATLQSSQVEEGILPEYTGATPVRPEDEQYTYSFNGWSPAIVAATADATYTATYTATPKNQGIEEVPSDQVPCTKVLRNGQIFILRGEKVYTVTGQEVR